MKTLIANIMHALRNNETVTIGGGEFGSAELYRVVQLHEAATKAEEALAFSYGGEPLPTLEKEAIDALRLALRD
jgi:hypothetical protein